MDLINFIEVYMKLGGKSSDGNVGGIWESEVGGIWLKRIYYVWNFNDIKVKWCVIYIYFCVYEYRFF